MKRGFCSCKRRSLVAVRVKNLDLVGGRRRGRSIRAVKIVCEEEVDIKTEAEMPPALTWLCITIRFWLLLMQRDFDHIVIPLSLH